MILTKTENVKGGREEQEMDYNEIKRPKNIYIKGIIAHKGTNARQRHHRICSQRKIISQSVHGSI